MRLKEFKIDERQYLKEKYPHLTEEQLDEILPAIGAAAGMAGRLAVKGATAAGRLGAKMGKGALSYAKQGAGKLLTKGTNMAKQVTKNVAKAGQQIATDVADKAGQTMLKVGSQIPIGGQTVKVDKLQGDEVTFADPKNPNAPKTVVKKNSPIVKAALSALIPR